MVVAEAAATVVVVTAVIVVVTVVVTATVVVSEGKSIFCPRVPLRVRLLLVGCVSR